MIPTIVVKVLLLVNKKKDWQRMRFYERLWFDFTIQSLKKREYWNIYFIFHVLYVI